jgi:hypothetical protein
MKVQRVNKSKRIRDVVERLLKKHDNYLKNLATPKELVEFCPSIEQQRTVILKNQEQGKNIQRQVHQQSVFLSIMPMEILLYGRSSFTAVYHEDGKTSPNVMPLHEVSFSMEMPRLMMVDPAGFNQMIKTFKFEKKVY